LGQAGDTLKTLLGSCVSVILTDPRRTVGVMCHIVHVGHPNAANKHNTAFGSVAMADMVRRLYQVGFAPRSCEAYVVGGGNMFPNLFTHHHVGANNVDWVLGYLEHHKIRILKQDLGALVTVGCCGRLARPSPRSRPYQPVKHLEPGQKQWL
jgi:chemotaxis protein CheD